MTESVEQAALRRAIDLDNLPAPWPDVLASLQAIVGVNDSLFGLVKLVQERHDAEIETLHAENAELRDGLLALSNRIENVTRNAQMPERPCPRSAVVHEPHVYRRGEDVFLCLGVKP